MNSGQGDNNLVPFFGSRVTKVQEKSAERLQVGGGVEHHPARLGPKGLHQRIHLLSVSSLLFHVQVSIFR